MAVQHRTVTVGTTATDLTSAVLDKDGFEDVTRSVTVQNTAGATLYVGGPGVTTADYGLSIPADTIVAFDLRRTDVLYGVLAAAGDVHVMHTGV